MIETIREAIASINALDATEISDWRLVERIISRQERYYIANKSEQARSVDDRIYSLTIYVDSNDVSQDSKAASGAREAHESPSFRGEATITIQPSFSLDDCIVKIRHAVFAASTSHNPWFALPVPAAHRVTVPVSGFSALSSSEQIEVVRAAFYSAESRFANIARINALELFITKERKRLLNSCGIDYSSETWKGYSEFVVEADSPSGTVELFDDIEFSEPDYQRLSETITNRLTQVCDRARAQPMPSLSDIPVILRSKEAEEAFAWFFGNARTESIYSKASAFEIGKSVQRIDTADSERSVTEPLDLWAEPILEGLPSSAAFDVDGYPLERTQVIERSILKTLTGSVRHADWLGVPRKGAFPLFSVAPGAMSLAEMHSAPYLEPVMFSDFQLDAVTGDFGAEVRLAYYFDGTKVIPVRGGSISGALSTISASMRRSTEVAIAARARCPIALMLFGVTITGLS